MIGYINLTLDNIDKEHICCSINDPRHQAGVDKKKKWIKSKLKDGHIFRKMNNEKGKMFIEYEPIETAWAPVIGSNYEYIYCIWVAGDFKGRGVGRELMEYAINDARNKGMNGICTITSKRKKPFLGEKSFYEHFGFKVVDMIGDYQLLALQFTRRNLPRFSDTARKMQIPNKEFTIYYSPECPFVEAEAKSISKYAKKNNIPLKLVRINTLKKAKEAPCVFNNWANFYNGKFISNTILNDISFAKLVKKS